MIISFLTRFIAFYFLVIAIVLMLTGCGGPTYNDVSKTNKNVCNGRLESEDIIETSFKGVFSHIRSKVVCQHVK